MSKFRCLFFLMAFMAGLTSCLDDGDETFALEKGELDKLITANWKISDARLFNQESGEYHSALVNDAQLGRIFILDVDGVNALVEPDNSVQALAWNVDEAQHILNLNDHTYTIESLGKELMVLSCYAEVNNEQYLKKYYLKNIGKISDLDEIEDPDENATYVVSTDGSGRFRRNGYRFTIPMGAVPKGDNGTNGSVAFSAQSIPNVELPGRAPNGIDFIEGSGILANPTNFIFASPIIIDVPLRGNSIESTCFYHWNGLQKAWEIVPYSSVNDGSNAKVSVIELGYFVLGIKRGQENMGGIRIDRSNLPGNYYYYLTLTNNSNFSSISFSSSSENLYMANVPLGKYKAQITREKRTQLESGATSTETSVREIDVDVQTRLVPSGSSLASFIGWTVLDLSSIEWENGRPESWGKETVTYGTGVFQATLNWVNYSDSTTDYDLHLTTPNGTEIYYSNEKGDGFELDRDVVADIGNCTENIYSVSEYLPKGTYKVRVHHYGGATGRSYNCRVILNGRVVSSYSGITNSGYQSIYSFTLE